MHLTTSDPGALTRDDILVLPQLDQAVAAETRCQDRCDVVTTVDRPSRLPEASANVSRFARPVSGSVLAAVIKRSRSRQRVYNRVVSSISPG